MNVCTSIYADQHFSKNQQRQHKVIQNLIQSLEICKMYGSFIKLWDIKMTIEHL